MFPLNQIPLSFLTCLLCLLLQWHTLAYFFVIVNHPFLFIAIVEPLCVLSIGCLNCCLVTCWIYMFLDNKSREKIKTNKELTSSRIVSLVVALYNFFLCAVESSYVQKLLKADTNETCSFIVIEIFKTLLYWNVLCELFLKINVFGRKTGLSVECHRLPQKLENYRQMDYVCLVLLLDLFNDLFICSTVTHTERSSFIVILQFP